MRNRNFIDIRGLKFLLLATLFVGCLVLPGPAQASNLAYREYFSSLMTTTQKNNLASVTITNFDMTTLPGSGFNGSTPWFGVGSITNFLGLSSAPVFVGVQPSGELQTPVAVIFGVVINGQWNILNRWDASAPSGTILAALNKFTTSLGGVLVYSSVDTTLEANDLPVSIRSIAENKIQSGFVVPIKAGCNFIFKSNLGFLDTDFQFGNLFKCSTNFASIVLPWRAFLPNDSGNSTFETGIDPALIIPTSVQNPVFKSIQRIEAGFSVNRGAPILNLGLDVHVDLPNGANSNQDFAFSGGINISSDNAAFEGFLSSDSPWENAFGVGSLAFDDVRLLIGKVATASYFGLGATVALGDTPIELAGALPMTNGGLKATVNDLPIDFGDILIYVADEVMKVTGNPRNQIVNFATGLPRIRIKDFGFSVSGGGVPALGIPTGLHVKGIMEVGGSNPLRFADVDFNLTQAGVVASCTISPLDFGGVSSSILTFDRTILDCKLKPLAGELYLKFKFGCRFFNAVDLDIDGNLNFLGLRLSTTASSSIGDMTIMLNIPVNRTKFLSDTQFLIAFAIKSELNSSMVNKFLDWLEDKVENELGYDVNINDWVSSFFPGKTIFRLDYLGCVANLQRGIVLNGKVTFLDWSRTFTANVTSVVGKVIAEVATNIFEAAKSKLWSPIYNWLDENIIFWN